MLNKVVAIFIALLLLVALRYSALWVDLKAAKYGRGIFSTDYQLIFNTELSVDWNRIDWWIAHYDNNITKHVLGESGVYKTFSGESYKINRIISYSVNTGYLIFEVESDAQNYFFIFDSEKSVRFANPKVIKSSDNNPNALLQQAAFVSAIHPPFYAKYWRLAVICFCMIIVIIVLTLAAKLSITLVKRLLS